MNKLEWALLFQVIASLFAFFQLQGHYVWTNLNFLKSMWWVYATSLIIAPLFWYSTKWSYEHFGAFWKILDASFFSYSGGGLMRSTAF